MAKFLDINGVAHLWNKIKQYIALNVQDVEQVIQDMKGQYGGIAGLNPEGHIDPEHLLLKTINGKDIRGSGNIEIDLNIFQIVTTLPTEGDSNKIYLILDSEGQGQNVYKEYLYVNNNWEIVGEYKANIDLTNYIKTTDTVTTLKNGIMLYSDKVKLDNIAANATKDEALTTIEIDEALGL